VLHFEKIITTCPGVGTALEGGFDRRERQVLVCCIQLSQSDMQHVYFIIIIKLHRNLLRGTAVERQILYR